MKKGFSLMELLIVISIIIIFGSVSAPSYFRFQQGNNLQVAFESINNSFNNAKTKARSVQQDSVWGVKITNTDATVFLGNSYAGRNTSFDEKVSFPGGINYSGPAEIIFNKLTGYPVVSSTITLTNNLNETKIFSLNERGGVTY
jgi:prepilin-type N-terminal cleavage/methylation domain-containing protein